MNIYEAMQTRNSVRKYTDKKIDDAIISVIISEVKACKIESGLNIQLIINEESAFKGFLARIGKFSGVKNYIAFVGMDNDNFYEKIGYYGECIVLKLQQLGLNSCWVSSTFNRRKCSAKIEKDEALVCVISFGYGATQGVPHKTKPMKALCKIDEEIPDWFSKGMEAVMLAPTAMNRQQFIFTFSQGKVKAEALYKGVNDRISLGIAKYHFEAGADKKVFLLD